MKVPVANATLSRSPASSAADGSSAPLERGHDILRQAGTNLLDTVFHPRSVALVGATETPGSVGEALWKNLAGNGLRAYPVNPRRATVFGAVAFSSVADLPEKVDLAVIATPAMTVPDVVRECGAAGVKACVIISAGFKECGPEGAALEQTVLAEARRWGMRVIGPNCLGVMAPHARLNATFARRMALPGSVAFLSQSGALCTAILDWSVHENVGFSAFVSMGAMSDVGWGDLIDWLGDDPLTKSIIIYMESIGDARAFLSAAREVALSKPIIVVKVGRHAAASRAVASHTGSLTGSDEVLDTAFKRAGVLRVDTIEELFDMSEVLAKQPRPLGPRLAIITNAGGPGALATDMLMESGGELAALSAETMAALQAELPPHWSHGNPVDVLGDADAARFTRALKTVAVDAGVDGMLLILTPQAMTEPAATATALGSLAKSGGKPVLASLMGASDVEEGRSILNQGGIPTYDYPDAAARAFALMWRREENLRQLYETPDLVPEFPDVELRQKRTATIIDAALGDGRVLLSKLEVNDILESYGLPATRTLLATDESAAVERACSVGYPVALKLHSSTITHKSDVGGVKLNLGDDAAVRAAWHQIKNGVKPHDFEGVTVEPMVSTKDGIELIVGSSTDPQFGPVLLFGAGGTLVEVMKDRALSLPPLTTTLARRMIGETRVCKALKGVRGAQPVDLVALSQLLVRFSRLVTDQPRIKEIEINPLLATPQELMALDVRVILHPANVADDALPRAAIRPYPWQHVGQWKTRDGAPVVIRPIRPEDEPMMVAFHRALSERSVRNRWFGLVGLEQRTAHERLSRLCFVDYSRTVALVVEHEREDGTRQIIGVGRLTRLHGMNEAEFALIVTDTWQGRGIGTELLRRLVQIGREEKLARITADVLADNHEMLAVSRKAGFHVRTDLEEGERRLVLDL